MNTLNHKTENASAGNKRVRHRSGHSKKKRRLSTRIFKWIRRNPVKIIGILCILVIIYLTFLFIQLERKQHPPSRDEYFEAPK